MQKRVNDYNYNGWLDQMLSVLISLHDLNMIYETTEVNLSLLTLIYLINYH